MPGCRPRRRQRPRSSRPVSAQTDTCVPGFKLFRGIIHPIHIFLDLFIKTGNTYMRQSEAFYLLCLQFLGIIYEIKVFYGFLNQCSYACFCEVDGSIGQRRDIFSVLSEPCSDLAGDDTHHIRVLYRDHFVGHTVEASDQCIGSFIQIFYPCIQIHYGSSPGGLPLCVIMLISSQRKSNLLLKQAIRQDAYESIISAIRLTFNPAGEAAA